MATRIVLCLLLAACASTDQVPPIDLSKAVSAEQVLTQPLERRLLAAALPVPNRRGLMRLIHTPTSCWSRDGVVPYVYPAWSEPKVGRMLAIDWTTRACRPFTSEPAALLISFDPIEPWPLTVFGHRDCYLTVGIGRSRDYLVTPGPGSILSQEEPGRVSLRWIPGPEWAGQTIYAQLIVLSAAGNNGWLNSPGIELQIGG